MKIAITSEYFHPYTGGAEQSALELSKALKNMGHEVVVFTRGDGERDEVEGVEVRRVFKVLKNWTARRDVPFPRYVDKMEERHLSNEIRNEGFDILHSNNRDTALFTARTGRLLGIPVVAHIRDYWPLCPKRDFLRPEGICPDPDRCGRCMARYFDAWHKLPFYKKMSWDTRYRLQALRTAVDGYIYNSSYTRKRIGLEPGKVIFNPVNLGPVQQRDGEPGKVLFIGNVTHRKGIQLLARAVAGLDLTLHVVGDGYLLPEINGDNIITHGRLEYQAMLEHLSTAEMLVVPSLWPEPFGRVAVEAMAAGVPVIASGVGGLPEVVGDAGIILDNIGVGKLRETIQKVHEDEELRLQMITKGKERSKIFEPEKIARDIIQFYETVIGSK